MSESLKVLTLNLHKGFSHLNEFVLPRLREALRELSPDLVFLQEVLGENHLKTKAFSNATRQSQYEYLADSVWTDYAYGKNALTSEGHHGNAVLSKFSIERSLQRDISTYSLEQRGLLHSEIAFPTKTDRLHCICLHLNLLGFHRIQQFKWIVEYIESHIPKNAPLILAGDLNDWTHEAERYLASPLRLHEAFLEFQGQVARSFPGFFPLFKLDRIYFRNFSVRSAEVLKHSSWTKLSDHAALFAELSYEKSVDQK